MLGAVPGEPAPGRGPRSDDDYSRRDYDHPAAGWGTARSVARVLELRFGIADFSTESEQPVTKHLVVDIRPVRREGALT